MNELSYEETRRLFNYDPNTGVLSWKVSRGTVKAGKIINCKNQLGYIKVRVYKKAFYAHRIIWMYIHGVWPKQQIDHINGIPDDNRISNLREANHYQNNYNKPVRKDSTSGYKGIFFNKLKNLWGARCTVDGKRKSLGYYKSAEDAYNAYINFSKIAHGDFHHG